MASFLHTTIRLHTTLELQRWKRSNHPNGLYRTKDRGYRTSVGRKMYHFHLTKIESEWENL